jgi:hypothetical protein
MESLQGQSAAYVDGIVDTMQLRLRKPQATWTSGQNERTGLTKYYCTCPAPLCKARSNPSALSLDLDVVHGRNLQLHLSVFRVDLVDDGQVILKEAVGGVEMSCFSCFGAALFESLRI